MTMWKVAADASGTRYAVLIAGGSLLIILVSVVFLFAHPQMTPRFDAIPGAQDMTAAELAEFVDVRRIDLHFPLGDKRAADRALWDLISKPFGGSFSAVTTQDWEERWALYASKLVEKAEEGGLPGQSLKTCLDIVGPPQHGAQLPVAAYLVASDRRDIWIISCKWGVALDPPTPMSHVCAWAFTVDDQSQVAFTTCN